MTDATAHDVVARTADWSLETGDCLPWMRDIIGNTGPKVDLLVIDPPFGIGYEYDGHYDDRKTADQYLSWCDGWMSRCRRFIKPTGSFWLAIGDEYAAELNVMAKGFGFVQRDWVVWNYTFGVHLTSKFGRDHTHLMHFVLADKGYTWNPDAVRVPSKRQSIYGDKRANPAGRVPGNSWNFPRLAGTHKKRAKGHPCQIPESIFERIILSCSNPGDVVADPMCGSGGCGAVAVRLGRRFCGCELSPNYAATAVERIGKEAVTGV